MTKQEEDLHSSLRNRLQVAQLRAEKCDLGEAKEAYWSVFQLAQESRNSKLAMEALAGLLRLAGEALDPQAIAKWDKELDSFMAAHPHSIPPLAWYCKGAVSRGQGQFALAQRNFHRTLRAVSDSDSELLVRSWVALAALFQQMGHSRRSAHIAACVLKRYEAKNIRGINGIIYLLLGTLNEKLSNLEEALRWFQKAHSQFLSEHNWYYHLYVLYGYARLARLQHDYSKAYWYLDLVDKAASGSEFGLLRREISIERDRLESDAVDLLIDSRRGIVKTRESGQLLIRKQYVLLHILEVLSKAHSDRENAEKNRGLSKAELIERVWKENYRPKDHDNKLYYNINRLRKLIEPDVRKPQYLLNWKEGYRLAPGLRVQVIGDQSSNFGGRRCERK